MLLNLSITLLELAEIYLLSHALSTCIHITQVRNMARSMPTNIAGYLNRVRFQQVRVTDGAVYTKCIKKHYDLNYGLFTYE